MHDSRNFKDGMSYKFVFIKYENDKIKLCQLCDQLKAIKDEIARYKCGHSLTLCVDKLYSREFVDSISEKIFGLDVKIVDDLPELTQDTKKYCLDYLNLSFYDVY